MSKAIQDDSTDMLSAEGLATLTRLLAANAHARVARADVDGRRVWIKRYDVERQPFGKRLHRAISPLLPVFLRSSRAAPGSLAVEREKRKMNLFRQAGFAVAGMVFGNEAVLVLSDVGRVAQARLGDLHAADPAAHDELLVTLAQGLGEAHRAGLCHGRPHPRDMFLPASAAGEGGVGFLDFEEEPEAVMPLAMAQARDLWLLFLQITARAILPDTPARAFGAWRDIAPAEVLPPLARLVAFFHRWLAPLRLLPETLLGKDALYAVKATSFLKNALDAEPASAPSLQATGHERPEGQS